MRARGRIAGGTGDIMRETIGRAFWRAAMIRFPDMIRKHAFHRPNHRAIHFEGRDFDWQTFSARVHGMARALADLGIAPGDRVAFLGQNSHWMIETYFAPCLIGAIMLPVNYRLSEDEQVALLDDSAPRVLIVDRHYQSRAAALIERSAATEILIFADWDPPEPGLPAGALILEDLIKAAGDVPPDAFDDRASGSDDAMLIFYTSGSTGVPKGVMLSHANLLSNALGSGPLFGYTPEDVSLFTGPLFHLASGSRVYTSILFGTSIVIQSRFDVVGMMELVQNQRITMTTLVPTMLQMILDHPRFAEFDFSSMRCLVYGGAPMPVALMQRLMDTVPGLVFAQGYGMTEASPLITVLPAEDHRMVDGAVPKTASVGRPVTHCDIRVVDAHGHPVAQGDTGEVVVRGPQIMLGYWNRPDETAEAIRGGFYFTGDAGYFDADGYLYLSGRKKEMIISGGENIYPIETENCLSQHPAIAAAAVIGLPDDTWGEVVTAAVSLKPGQQASADDIIAHCRQRIAHYKAPKRVTIWDGPLPLNPANKIDKNRIRALLTQADDV